MAIFPFLNFSEDLLRTQGMFPILIVAPPHSASNLTPSEDEEEEALGV